MARSGSRRCHERGRQEQQRGIGSGAVLALTVISVVVGLAMAVAYHVFAARVQRWAGRRNTMAGPAAVLLGFFGRLAIFTIVLLVIGLWTPLNMIAVCLAFVVLFTILNFWSVYSLMSNRRNVPPSAGATGL